MRYQLKPVTPERVVTVIEAILTGCIVVAGGGFRALVLRHQPTVEHVTCMF